jgi:glycosyltransferase involved in cell wall biosynthesis
MTVRIGVHFIRRRLLRRAEAHGGRTAHSSVFRCAAGFEALCGLSTGSVRYEAWDEREPAEDFVRRVDALVGIPDIRLFTARERTGCRPPYLALVMGDATRAVPFSPVIMKMLQPDDTLICSCTADLEVLAETLEPPAPDSLAFAPMPSDLSLFTPRAPLPETWAAALDGFDPARPLILSAERMTPAKGVHRIIPFAAFLRDQGHRPVLAFLGDDGSAAKSVYRARLEAIAAEHGLARSSLFLPFADATQLGALYARASLVVSASTIYDNNFGYVPIEAQVVGTPPVVTDWGGYRDSVLDGVTGLHMPTRLESDGSVSVDWLPAARAADALLCDEAARDRMREAGRRHMAENYSIAASFRIYAELAHDALARDRSALADWRIGELGRIAVAAGWTDQTDNPDRTGRVPRSAPTAGADYDRVHRAIYRKYATHPQKAEKVAP